MKIKTAIMLIIIFIFSSLNLVYAEEAKITCSTEVNGNIISITGQIPNTVKTNKVSLIVGTIDNIIYIDQTKSGTDGNFSFTFQLAEEVAYGAYPFKIGSNSGFAPYEGTLVYPAPIEFVQNKFIDADLDVSISAYVPSVSGTISCTQGKTITVNVLNKTDNTVIANETITSENGIYNVSYTLPSLLYPKEYEMTFSCAVGSNTLTAASVTIDSHFVSVDVAGTVTTSDNVSLDLHLQSVNTDLINKSKTFTGSKTISETIPNILASASFNLTVQGYEAVEADMPECEYKLNTSDGEESVIFINFEDMSGFAGRNIEIEFNADEFTLTDGCAFTPQKEVSAQSINNIQIVSVSDGKLVFKFNKDTASGYEYSGTANVIKLTAKTDGEKTVLCKVTSK